jgi:hypothetical protein
MTVASVSKISIVRPLIGVQVEGSEVDTNVSNEERVMRKNLCEAEALCYNGPEVRERAHLF